MKNYIRPLAIILKKEVKSYFDHPVAYIILIFFIAINNFFYFRSAFLFNSADLRPMFNVLIWIFLFIIPAITMQTLAEEKQHHTIELLLVQPIRKWQVLVGKFLGSLSFIIIGLLLTLFIPFSLMSYGQFDWGIIFTQYLGAIMLSSAAIAIGILASSTTKNQIVSFIIAVAIIFGLIIIGFETVLLSAPSFLKPFFEQLSLSWHFSNITRGVIDFRDIIYFATTTAVFLFVSYWLMIKENINPKRPFWRKLKIGIATLAGVAIIINLMGLRIHGRIDLTNQKLYTLSPATKNIIHNIPDVVTIDFYRSKELPPEVAIRSRDVSDFLSDYDIESGGKIHFIYHNLDATNVSEAENNGIQPVQFNILKSDEFQVKKGYFGLTISYLDKKEIIPFIEKSDDFEYQVTSLIKKLTTNTKYTVGILSGHEEKNIYSDYAMLGEELRKQYNVTSTTLNKDTGKIDNSPDILIIAGPKTEINEKEKETLQSYVNNGGKAMFLIDTVIPSQQTLQVSQNSNSLADLVEKLGVRVNNDITGDLRSQESISFGKSGLSYILPYPFWPKAIATEDNPITKNVKSIVLPWPSSLSINTNKANSITLLTTTDAGFIQEGDFQLMPNQDFNLPQNRLSQKVLAVAIASPENSDNQSVNGIRFVVIGDSDFLTDQFVNSNPQAIVFALNAVDWLAQDEQLIAVRSKQRTAPSLIFSQNSQKIQVKYLNLVGIPLAVAVFGIIYLWRRRKFAKKKYFPLN